MVLTSPRSNGRTRDLIPHDWPDEREHRGILAEGVRHLQDYSTRHPIEAISISATYTMADIDLLIVADATAAAITVNLLTAAGREGRRIIVQKSDASANLVTIDPAGTEKLNDSTTVGLSQKNSSREYVSNGVDWRLIAAIGNATDL